MISFISLEFIFRFLPIFLIAYYLTPTKYRNITLIVGSLIFYAFGEPLMIILLASLMVINYLIANIEYKNVYSRREVRTETMGTTTVVKLAELNGSEASGGMKRMDVSKRLPYMIMVVTLDVLVLVVFKVLGTFVDKALFPIGLSFYIFKMISFQIDIYRGEIPKKPEIFEVLAYFSLFPQITQGPIMRFEEGSMGEEKRFSWDNIEEGLIYFVAGFAMKTILADRIGILWNDLSMYGYQSISTPLAWLGAFAYSFELYFDFWGYSLMASGIMVMLGFDFIRNFDSPYASKSISEFYRRWHMTLGAFFRDYIYFPLGGSHGSNIRMVVNLGIVWILTGLWHGNGYNFLLWGVILGILIILEKLFYGKKLKEIPFLGNVYVIILIPLTWVVFAIDSIKNLGAYFGRLFPMFSRGDVVVNSQDIFMYLKDYWWMFVVAIILCVPQVPEFLNKHKKNPIATAILMILFWYSVYFSASSAGNPFMYLHF